MKIAIVDDDFVQRSELRGYVSEFFHTLGKSFECFEFCSCVDFISDYKTHFDIVLMDIEMPGMDGLTGAKKLRQLDQSAVLIFITHMAQYAIKGYEVDALDFMLKPVTYFNLSMKLNKAMKFIKPQLVIPLVSDGVTTIVKEEDILYVEGYNQYVIYHTVMGDYKVHATLKVTEEKLGGNFSRCNNSFIVNLSHITKIDGNLVCVEKEKLPISRGRKKLFLDDVNRFFGGI